MSKPPADPTMKVFKGFRTREQIEAECKNLCWLFDATKHDKDGSDYVSVGFAKNGVFGNALVSVFNGRFFGTLEDGTEFTSDNAIHENEPWFQALMEVVYTV